MPGKNNPMMGHKPKMDHGKPMKVGPIKVAEAIAEKEGYDLVKKASMYHARAKMAMPKKDSPLNFKAMDFEMAKAIDYNQGKPMMYHGKPMMDHGKPMMGHGPKMYGKPKMTDPKIKTEKLAEVDLGTVKKKDGSVKNPFYGSSVRNFISRSTGKSLALGTGTGSSVATFRNMLNQQTVPANQLARFKKQFKRK